MVVKEEVNPNQVKLAKKLLKEIDDRQLKLKCGVVEEAGWKEGMELEAEHKQGRIILRPAEADARRRGK